MAIRNPQIALKPQDLLICFKLVCVTQHKYSYAALANSLGISTSEAHACVSRLSKARLVALEDPGFTAIRSRISEFVIHGAAYAFPAIFGSPTRGMPTAYAGPPLNGLINQPDDLPPVWPDPTGEVRGIALFPLYPTAPRAARSDTELYENLALFDALRSGAARERELAKELLSQRL